MRKYFSSRRLAPSISIILLFIFLSSCGGGSDSSSSNTLTSTGTISGSVSGTTVIAVDDSGKIISSDDTKGRLPDLDLDNDGTDESYSFTIIGVPVGLSIRIYLVKSQGVFPMYFDDNGTDANVLSLSSATAIDLGFVDSINGMAIPLNNPLDTQDIISEGADTVMKTISGAEIEDFVGTWHGDVDYFMVDGESGTANVTITLSAIGGLLVGTFYESVEGWTVDITGSETNGIFTFDLPTATPNNPDCANWDVSFTAILDTTHTKMDLTGSGTFCGSGGGKSGTFSDYINKQ